MAAGVCKLTGKPGVYVDAHIIPKALTRPASPGLAFLEGGGGRRPGTRFSSWYDNHLVTAEGEAILRDHDTWAIRFLRKHHLIWGSWGSQLRPPGNQLVHGTHGFRRLFDGEWTRLRLFFLSLLWRAAASNRREFKDIRLDRDPLEKLRDMVANGRHEPLDFFPVQLIQLSTRGEVHNHTPITMQKRLGGFDQFPQIEVPIFRFYFDGLIIHFDRRSPGEIAGIEKLTVGCDRELMVYTLSYEESFQRENLARAKRNAEAWRRPKRT